MERGAHILRVVSPKAGVAMKNVGYTFLGLLIASSLSLAGTGTVLLKLTALDPVAKAGAKVMIRVTTSNQSEHVITYHETPPTAIIQ